MTKEIISWSISTKVWDQAGIELATPGSAVRLASVARHVTNCATRPGHFEIRPDILSELFAKLISRQHKESCDKYWNFVCWPIWSSTGENLSSGFLTNWDSNQAAQLQRLFRKLKFCLQQVESLSWVKVQNFQNPELLKSNPKTCSIPTKYSLFQV